MFTVSIVEEGIPSHFDTKKVLNLKSRNRTLFGIRCSGFRASQKEAGRGMHLLEKPGTDFDFDLCAVYNEKGAEVAEW